MVRVEPRFPASTAEQERRVITVGSIADAIYAFSAVYHVLYVVIQFMVRHKGLLRTTQFAILRCLVGLDDPACVGAPGVP